MTDELQVPTPPLPQPKSKIKNGAWVLLVLFLGLTTVAGVLYYKHQKNLLTVVQVGSLPTKTVELEACNDKTLALEKEVLQLRAKLKDFEQVVPTAPAAATSSKKRIVEVKAKQPQSVKPQPTKDTTNAPQSSWNSTPVPAPMLNWLQHD